MPPPANTVDRPPGFRLRRWLLGAVGMTVVLLVGAWLARFPLTAAAVTAGLQRAGAGDIHFALTRVSPWEVGLDDLAFRIKTQQFSARRVTLDRDHWWQTSLGAVRVEGLRVPVVVDGSDVNPQAWAKYSGTGPTAGAISVPAEQLSVDGVLAIQAASVPEQPLALKFSARPAAGDAWAGTLNLTGAGFALTAEASFAPAAQRLDFHTTAASLDLKVWQEFIQRAIVIPGGAPELAGLITGRAEGSYLGRKLSVTGALKLRDGSFRNQARSFSVAGVEADFEVADFKGFRTKPGTLRARELRSGDFVATNLAFDVAFAGANHLDVSRATLLALGGTLTAEPFKLQLDQDEIEATVLADGLDVTEIMALSKDVPASAVGRVNGRLPIRIDAAGLRFGTGWLELKSGVRAEVQFKAAGLLTSGVSPASASYGVLHKVETGMMRLKLTELRIDVRPPNAPPGRSAQLHIAGEPVDPGVKAPVTLDLNINGPLEQLINLSMDKRVSFGSGK